MIFEIINPSDAYTIEAEEPRIACVCTIVLGEGQYSLDEVDGDFKMPLFVFSTAERVTEWFVKTFGLDVDSIINEVGYPALSKCLRSVVIGKPSERSLYIETMAALEEKGEDGAAATFRDHWNDSKRSSLNDIGSRAIQIADRFDVIAERNEGK